MLLLYMLTFGGNLYNYTIIIIELAIKLMFDLPKCINYKMLSYKKQRQKMILLWHAI